MRKQTQSTRIDKILLTKVRKIRKRQTIQGFIETAIEERIEKVTREKK